MTEKNKNNYDLEGRTTKFSEDTIDFLKCLKKDNINLPLTNQLIRSATSIGANYCEANGASSKKDFKNKIHICKKEAKETMYWLQLLGKTNLEHKDKSMILWKEAYELTMIFSKIIHTLSKN
jgi:four helix bundle protein